jgi:hypothetical protein
MYFWERIIYFGIGNLRELRIATGRSWIVFVGGVEVSDATSAGPISVWEV